MTDTKTVQVVDHRPEIQAILDKPLDEIKVMPLGTRVEFEDGSCVESALRSPIEVWLTQVNMQVTCRIIFEDEKAEHLDVDSLSMRGAQREMTGYLIGLGYKPAGRWEIEARDDVAVPTETSRKFKAD